MHTQHIFTLFRRPGIMAFFLLLGLINLTQAESQEPPLPTTIKKRVCSNSSNQTTINVTDWGTITDLNVVISGLTANEKIGYLSISLNDVVLLENPTMPPMGYFCTGTTITNLILDDEAQSSVQNCESDGTYVSGQSQSYRPKNFLNYFKGDNITGPWTIKVSSDGSGVDSTIDGWCLEYERENVVFYDTPIVDPKDVLNPLPPVKSKVNSSVDYASFSIKNELGWVVPFRPELMETLIVKPIVESVNNEKGLSYSSAYSLSNKLTNLTLISRGTTKNVSLVAPNATSNYTMTCEPIDLGEHPATLIILTNDITHPHPDYFLNCIGVQAFQSFPLPGSTLDLGSIEVGQITPIKTLNISEISGLESLNVFGSIGGYPPEDHPNDFFISQSTNPQTIGIGGKGSLNIGCKPTVMGTRTATLLLKFNDDSFPGGMATYPLTCEGLSPQYTSKPLPNTTSPINFGAVQMGIPLVKTIEVMNTGNQDLVVNASEEAFTGNGVKAFNLPTKTWKISPNKTVNIEVECRPPEQKVYLATLTLSSNEGANVSYSYDLFCEGKSAGYRSEPSPGGLIDFGYLPTDVQQTLKIGESGQLDLEISGYQIEGEDQDYFSVVGPSFPFKIFNIGSEEVDLKMECHSKNELIGAGRIRTAQLTLFTNAANFPSPSYDLRCSEPKAVYGSDPVLGESIDFTKVKVGQKEQRTLMIKSEGNFPLIVELEDSGLTGDMNDFSLITVFPLPDTQSLQGGESTASNNLEKNPQLRINSGNSSEVVIACHPTVPTVRTARLNLKSNDIDHPSVTYALTCSGWTDPPPPPPEEPTPIPPSEPPKAKLIVSIEGAGRGQVKSSPKGIDCATGDKDCQFFYNMPMEILLTAEAEQGSRFIGWAGPDDCLDGQVLMDMDKWCVASFAQMSHTLTVTREGEGHLTSSLKGLTCDQGQCAQDLIEGTTVTLMAMPASGWQFKGWEGACDNQGQVTLTSDQHCQAKFVQLTDSEVTLSVENVGPGKGTVTSQSQEAILCGGRCTQTYPLHATEILTALPAMGSIFVDWDGDCSGKNNSIEVRLDQSKRCQAHFELIDTPPYAHHILTLSITGLGQGSVDKEVQCANQCHQPVYPDGTKIILTPKVEKGSVFTGWSGDCQGNNSSLTLVMDQDKLCVAHFDLLSVEPQTYPLRVIKEGDGEGSINSNPEGIQITPSCECSEMTASYASGTTVLLATLPQLGSKLISLGGDAECTTGKIVLNKPITCIVTFAKEVLSIQETPVDEEKPLPPKLVIPTIKPSLQGKPPCPIEGTINVICNYKNEWQLKDIGVGGRGNISNLGLEGTIYNQGWISNAQLQPGTFLEGGVLTGYISNEGVIKDVVFRGATLMGGTLMGTIISEDRLSTIQDVHLAPETYLMGGELAGKIDGDPNHPALLENVTIAEGTSLSHLVIGKGVKFKGKVNLGAGVILVDPSTPKEDLSKFINREMDAQGQILREITIGETGKISNVVLEGRILNQGLLEDATIKESGHLVGGLLMGQIVNHGTVANLEFQGDLLSGGLLAGTIRTTEGGTLQGVELSQNTHLIGGTLAGEVEGHGARLDQVIIQGTVKDVIIGQEVRNEGILQDIEFRGELLTGGLLAGEINNTQGGTLKDIRLDAGASLVGGNLQGDILGEAGAPAHLDQVNIVGGSYLEHVIIGEQVTLAKNVTFGPGVQFIHPPQEEEVQAAPVVPLAIGIDQSGQIVTSKTTFAYDLVVSEKQHPNGTMLSTELAQEVDLSAIITLQSDHVGQAAEILIASVYKPSPTEPPEIYLQVNHKWLPWDYNLDTLRAASFSQALPEKLKVPIFKGDDLSATPGEYTLLVGYRLESGTIIYNGRNPFYFFIDGAPKTCVLYAVQDEKLNDSQFVKIDLSRSLWGTLQAFGPMYAGRDIEGLTLHPSNPNVLYATSGDDANVEGQHLDGYLYTLDKKTAKLTLIGPTGFSQVAALGADPIRGELWGWGEITTGHKREWSGLIQIDPNTGKAKPIKQFTLKESMGGLAVSPDGSKIYTSSGGTLWVYDKESQEMQQACDHITKGRIEGLDMQPNGILLLGIDLNQTTTITAYDPQTCEVVNTRTYHEVDYDDLESIVWPATECNDQSWLNRDS